MDKFFVIVMVFVVVCLFSILFALLDIKDILCSMRFYVGHIDDCISLRTKEKKTDIDTVEYEWKYKNLKLRVGRLEEIVSDYHDNFCMHDGTIGALEQKYQSMVETVDEVVDDQLQQDAEHEKAIEVISEKLKLIADCLDRELGTGIDVRLKFEEMDDNDD